MVQISLAMAFDRKLAILHIGGLLDPLSTVAMQIYLWGETQTSDHWKKELAAIIQNIRKYRTLKGGKSLKKKDIIEALDGMASSINIKQEYIDLQKDPSYSGNVTKRSGAPSTERVHTFVKMLANYCLDENEDKWSIANKLIENINEWDTE